MAEIQVVVFDLNNELCSVSTSQVYKIERYSELSAVPQLPDYIKGLYDLRGRVVPIIDLNKRFSGSDTQITKKTKIIITEKEEQLYGFIVNNVIEILNLSGDSIDTSDVVINVNNKNYIKGVGKKNDKLFSIIDLNSILLNEEVVQVNNVIESNK